MLPQIMTIYFRDSGLFIFDFYLNKNLELLLKANTNSKYRTPAPTVNNCCQRERVFSLMDLSLNLYNDNHLYII